MVFESPEKALDILLNLTADPGDISDAYSYLREAIINGTPEENEHMETLLENALTEARIMHDLLQASQDIVFIL